MRWRRWASTTAKAAEGERTSRSTRVVMLTGAALLGFAANRVLRRLALRALVPLLAAAAGLLLLDEPASVRLLVAAAAITGGVALAIRGRS